MIIQVLGTGCTKCKTLYEIVNKAVQETGVDAEVEKVEDIQKIMAYRDPDDAGPGHQRRSQGRRPGAEPGGNQEDDPGGQGSLTTDMQRRGVCHGKR